jgi:hypothetical protein
MDSYRDNTLRVVKPSVQALRSSSISIRRIRREEVVDGLGSHTEVRCAKSRTFHMLAAGYLLLFFYLENGMLKMFYLSPLWHIARSAILFEVIV